MTRADVAVLGAGPAGLAAAWRAALGGHRVVVLERAPAPGGMAAGFEVAGLRVDHGSHRLHPSIEPAILATLGPLVGPLQWRRRRGRIHLEDRWVAFPLRATDLARSLPPSFVAGAARDAVTARWRRPAADTLAEVVRAGLGPTMLERFYGPYAAKLWGTPAEELSGRHARQRIGAGSAGALAGKVLRRGGRGFWYPARGFGAIVEGLAEATARAGAEVRLGAEVTEVRLRPGGGARIAAVDGSVLEAGRVWSTLPLTALARLVRPAPPPEVVAAAGRLRFRAMVLVYLALAQPRWTPYDAHYLPHPGTAVSRVSEPKNYRDGPDDPAGTTVLCAEVPCWVGDETWRAPDGALGASVAQDLGHLGLPPIHLVEVVSRRLPAVYPVVPRGGEDDVAALDGWAASLEGVLSFGRGGLLAHDNTHHALAMGWAAARAVRADGSWDAAAWRRAREGFSRHVVED